jgi:hypothetical protein
MGRVCSTVSAHDAVHASLADPLLDTMNFLNEIAMRYPEAISFAAGRPYDGFFDMESVFAHLRRYLNHPCRIACLAPADPLRDVPVQRHGRADPGGGGTHAMRLSTSYLSLVEIEQGVARLAGFIASES